MKSNQFAIITKLSFLICMLALATPNSIGAQSKADKKVEEKATEVDSTAAKKDSSKMLSHVVKKCKKFEGLFNMYQDTTEGKAYIEISADKIGKEFIHFFHAENGSAESGWVKGTYGWESILKVEKYFDRIEFVGQNPHYYYDPESPLSKTANADINNPIVFMSKIIATSDKKDTFLIEANELFLTEALTQLKYLPPPGMKMMNPFNIGNLSKSKTKYSSIRSYPNNVRVVVDYTFENPYPTNFGSSVTTDPRYTSIQLQHNLIEMPVNNYKPRFEDPRIGYFSTEVTDQTSKSVTPYRDLIHRWHLEKKDPNAEISEPVEPIVYWMENTTPTELRPVIKKAVESWNIAFEKAGFKNAVVVKQQPDNADWDAGDIRYNVLRWTSAPMVGSAWGPSFVNPRTGQILGSDIMLDYVFVKGLQTMDKLFGVDGKTMDQMMFEHEEYFKNNAPHVHSYACTTAHHKKSEYTFGKIVGNTLGYTEEELKTIEDEMITELLLHEVGHTLGLNHNFKSSQLRSPEEMNDKELTSKHGLTGSVMDYNPFNLALTREEQGQFQATVPGPYDLWAIEFGYTPDEATEEETNAKLQKILARSGERELVFGNDADAMGSPGMGIDPTIIRWDMSSDVIAYGENRIKLCEKTMKTLKDQLSKDGESYQQLLVGYNVVMSNYFSALSMMKQYIGGVKIDRAMVGQENGGKPFTPIAYSEQKRAMDALIKYGFSPDAFMVTNDLYAYLQIQRRGFNFFGMNEDPKIHDRIASYHRSLLSHMMHPTVLKRMSDTRYYGNIYTVNSMMSDLTNGIYSADLKGSVNTVRQNLQHIYLDGLLAGMKSSRYDNISKSSMLSEIMKIREMMKSNKGKDEETKAHRKHIAFKIDQALDLDD